MVRVRRSIAALALAVTVPLVLAACAPAEGEPMSAFELVLPPPPGSDEHVGPLTVLVRAPEGVLDDIGPVDQVDVDDLGAATNVKAVRGRPDALRVGWMGGPSARSAIGAAAQRHSRRRPQPGFIRPDRTPIIRPTRTSDT